MRPLPLLALIAGACGAALPMYYKGSAKHYTLPLVAPLERRELVVPVSIEGKGPYLFLLDPYSSTTIDWGLADALELWRRPGTIERIDQRDLGTPLRLYEVRDLSTGDLYAEDLLVVGVAPGSLRFRDVPIAGILGGDLLSSTIVVDVDRDAGVVRLALTGHERPPRGAVRLDASVRYGALYTRARVAQHEATLVVHLRNIVNHMFSRAAARAGVAFGAGTIDVTDGFGTTVSVQAPGPPVPVTLGGGAIAIDAAFAPVADRRWDEVLYDGAIGQDVLSRFRVVFDRDHEALWLAPRDASLADRAADRLGRWPALASCGAAGCATAEWIRGEHEGDPPRLIVRRAAAAPGAPIEALFQPLDGDGAPLPAPLLRAWLDRGVPELSSAAHLRFFPGVRSFRLVDQSPHPAPCAGAACLGVVE